MSVIKRLFVILLTIVILSMGIVSLSCNNSAAISSTTKTTTDTASGLNARQISDGTIPDCCK